jgi:uncharacterized protein (TIGR03437 family)
VYDGLTYRSTDGGLTWPQLPASPVLTASQGANLGPDAVDAAGTLYGFVYGVGVYVSHDHGQTWTQAGSMVPGPVNGDYGSSPTALIAAGTAGTLYAIINQVATSGFVSKLSADGASLLYSTYLRGYASQDGFPLYLAEPGDFYDNAWLAGIALDPAGNMIVAGGTRSRDFPTVSPEQVANAGMADAFASKISADGSSLLYSTYLGGSNDDGALGVATDAQGNVIFTGQTWSRDFPVPGGVQPPAGAFGDMFVAKLSASPNAPTITTVVNGANFLQGIEAGSWVTIKGNNLANTNPGRTWRASDFTNGALPTTLDGVSVTIDGKPAYVEYISPAQINVVAPSDTAVGSVAVVVTNNGVPSGAAPVELQAYAPAFFQFGGTNYALASRLPDYALVADPGAVAGAVAAKPGDLIVLWGTGFGPTNAPGGQLVTGAPAAPNPTVTVGGIQVPVIDAVLTAGTAGLYQVTIQIPTTMPAGVAVVQATAGGVKSWAGALLFINPN